MSHFNKAKEYSKHTIMYHNIINNHPYNQGLSFDYVFSLNDLRLNPYIIEQNLAPILNPSFKETIYIEKILT